jgi:hypothetical protein
VDESGFYLLPGVVRTYAPAGQTPVLRAPRSRDHLSVIAGLTLGGRLLVQMQERAYQGPDIVGYLSRDRISWATSGICSAKSAASCW